jgi:hypothetical protein
MTDDDLPDLSERQEQVLARLPASKKALAEAFGVKPTTVEGHFNAIRDKGVSLEWDRDANEWFIADERSARLRSLSTRHKQSITREVSERIEEEQAYLFRRLRRTQPIQALPVQDAGHESFGVILGDLHFGDVVKKEYWDDDAGEYQTVRVYDSEIAAEKVATFCEKLLRIREHMASVATFDDCYLFLLGDISTGMHVYDGQVHHIDAPLKDQVEESVGALFQLVRTLAREFETVQVRGVPGNHGTDKPSAAIGANTDLLTYGWLDDRLRDIGLPNVDFRTAETYHHLNTTVRDWRYHVRHGDDEKEHVDETAASARDWRGLQDEFEFDVAMKGHHHSPAFHKVMNEYPVFSAPSPKPGGEFPSKIGKPDVSRHSDLGWVFGVSDTRPVTWQFLLDDR